MLPEENVILLLWTFPVQEGMEEGVSNDEKGRGSQT